MAKELLAGYKRFIQTDGYEVYETIAASHSKITLVGCMAHYPESRFIWSE